MAGSGADGPDGHGAGAAVRVAPLFALRGAVVGRRCLRRDPRLARHLPAPVRPQPGARGAARLDARGASAGLDRKSTRLNSSHITISYAVFCLKKKKNTL